ncbi:MAG: esterase/lipase family protein [Peptococcales bacterium]|jgi:pimeloyl-ACP methyl ester carboxylesterase
MLKNTKSSVWGKSAAILAPVMVLFLIVMPAGHTVKANKVSADANINKCTVNDGFSISLSIANTGIKALAADPENVLVLKAQVKDGTGTAVPDAAVRLEASGENELIFPGGCGTFRPSEGVTDAGGLFLSQYVPPTSLNKTLAENTVKLTASLAGSEKSGSVNIRLVPVPVILIHGYQASPDIFSGLSEYLKQQGFNPVSIQYDSRKGVRAAAAELSGQLDRIKSGLEDAGVQVSRFDLVTHSMGGLAARYYTCGNEYASRGDVRKLLFLSVPHKGSPFASIGIHYYQDASMSDMSTDSSLFETVFPSMVNAGLNPSIETGNMLGLYDEVVSLPNASLEDWNIKTEVFDLDGNNLTIDSLLNGEILKAANHKLILYNKKVYRRIKEMLENRLPYPALK